MEEIIEELKKMQVVSYSVGSTHWVTVTHINDPHSFFVRLLIYDDSKYLKALEEPGHLVSNTYCGMKVVYKSKVTKKPIRGQIYYIDYKNGEPTCDLVAIDYGFSERSVPVTNLNKPKNNIEVGPLSIHCFLDQCCPNGETFEKDAIDAMKFFIGTEKTKLVVIGTNYDKLIVKLINTCPDDIATMLALCEYTNLGYVSPTVSKVTHPLKEVLRFTYRKLNVGDVFQVRVQSGDSLKGFYVAEVNDYKAAMDARDDLTQFCKNHKSIEPKQMKVGLPVTIKGPGSTNNERAFITKILIPNEKVEVMLVDWGKKVETSYMFLKPLPKKFLKGHIIALYCEAEEKQIWKNGLHRFLYPGFEFIIKIAKVGKKFEIPNFVNISPCK